MGEDKYSWTLHARLKLKYYGLSESRIKRIIRFPARTEEGIVEGTIAVMSPAETKRYTEIWTMYKISKKRIRIITAWRYPGKSPARDPIPPEILKEVRKIL